MAKKFLTLNIGAANVELAEYELGAKNALTLVKYGVSPLSAPLDGGDAATILAPALLDLVREKGFKPGPVYLSLSGQMVFPKFAAIAAAGGEEKFEQMVRYEIEQGIPFPIDEMVCDRQVLGDTEAGDKSVMIVAAKLDQVEAITSAVQSVGFKPEIVDVAPIALVNAVRLSRGGDESCVIILDMGSKTTSLIISEGDKLYLRSIPVAGQAITKEIVASLGCTTEEAEALKIEHGYVSTGGVTEDEDPAVDRMSKACRTVLTRLQAEISRSVNFYRSQQQGGSPTRLYLTGGSALLPQVDLFFSEALGIEVEFFNPFSFITPAASVDASALESDAAYLGVTAGLALRPMEDGARFVLNLLPPSLIAERAEKAKIPYLIAGGLALAAALALVMLGFNHQTAVITEETAAVQTKVEGLASFDKKVAAADQAQTAATTEANALNAVLAARSKAVQRLTAVRNSLTPDMWIDRWEAGKITVRGWKDRLKGSGGKTAGELVIEKLKGMPVVDPASVKISDMSVVGAKGEVEQFTMEVKFK